MEVSQHYHMLHSRMSYYAIDGTSFPTEFVTEFPVQRRSVLCRDTCVSIVNSPPPVSLGSASGPGGGGSGAGSGWSLAGALCPEQTRTGRQDAVGGATCAGSTDDGAVWRTGPESSAGTARRDVL